MFPALPLPVQHSARPGGRAQVIHDPIIESAWSTTRRSRFRGDDGSIGLKAWFSMALAYESDADCAQCARRCLQR